MTARKILAAGKGYAELLDSAKAAKRSGGAGRYWIDVTLELLAEILRLESELQSTRQIEMFAPPSSNVSPRAVLHEDGR